MNHFQIYTLINSSDVLSLLKLSKVELKDLLGSELAEMQGYSQNNPHHCYNLLEHTLRTLLGLDFSGLSDTECFELKMAALYHDVGKPKVAFNKNGKTVFYNHAIQSSRIAKKELQFLGVDEITISRVCFLIENHDVFISFKFKEEIASPKNTFIRPITKNNINMLIKKIKTQTQAKQGFLPSYRDIIVLLRLCIADSCAQSERVIENGKQVDSKTQKLDRLIAIQDIVNIIG